MNYYSSFIVETKKIDYRLDTVLHFVASELDISVAAIVSYNRIRDVSIARQVYCKIARKLGFSFPRIGKQIKRCHSAVYHNVNVPFSDVNYLSEKLFLKFTNDGLQIKRS